MIVLQIEHPVPDFDSWKKAFDSDPLDRKQSGVERYRVFNAIDDPNYVIIELEFDNLEEAESMHESLKKLWARVDGKLINNPKSRIMESVEVIELSRVSNK
jgi:hypothetical protein